MAGYAAEQAIRLSKQPGTWEALGSAKLRGWVCPVCGAGVAPWVREHCAPKAIKREARG
jgi:hypothetical protein